MITVYKVVTWKRRLLLLVVFEYLPPLALYATIVKLHGIRRACMDARVVRHTLDIVTEKYAELVHAGRDAAHTGCVRARTARRAPCTRWRAPRTHSGPQLISGYGALAKRRPGVRMHLRT